MKVLVIPDCHLKPWMFAQANTIIKKGIADKAVCLMDLADDFGVHDDAQYLETYETAIAFAKEHPDTLWCYGNHDLSYIWGKPETGYHPEKRGLVCQEIKKLTNTLPKKSQLASRRPCKSLCSAPGSTTEPKKCSRGCQSYQPNEL